MKIRIFFSVLFFFLLVSKCVTGQEKPLEVSIGTIKTELKQNAIDFGIRYAKSLDTLFSEQDIFNAGKNSLFQATPEFNVQSGTNDAFSSINLKITGLMMIFRHNIIDSIETPCTSCYMHLLPISAGIESNNTFTAINGIIEIGYAPWYQSPMMKNVPDWIKHTKIGIFLQAGYKFNVDTTGTTLIGGQIDGSKEPSDSELFRAKGSFAIDTKSLFEISDLGIGLNGNADLWYDFLNDEVYFSLGGTIRSYITQNKDKYIDLKYQKGSGAPNFNKGDQLGVGLTLSF